MIHQVYRLRALCLFDNYSVLFALGRAYTFPNPSSLSKTRLAHRKQRVKVRLPVSWSVSGQYHKKLLVDQL